MSFIRNFGEKQAVKLIRHYTGKTVVPEFICTCNSDIALDWRGVVVLDNHYLWLVNRLGARGVAIANIVPDKSNGQYPIGTRGYPHYHFQFYFIDGSGSFNIYPITEEDGESLMKFLSRFEENQSQDNQKGE